MRIQWLGHAAVKLSAAGQVIYIDPVEMDYTGGKAANLFARPEPADIILFSHQHDDHCNPASYRGMLKPGTVLIGPASCREKAGKDMRVVQAGDSLSIGPAGIRAVAAYNIRRQRAPGVPFHPRGSGAGYVVTLEGRSIYHAGDTEPVPEMKDIGRIDVMLIPVDGQYTMSAAAAVAAAASFGGGVLVPMHYFNTTVADITAAAKREPRVKLRLLSIGETLEL